LSKWSWMELGQVKLSSRELKFDWQYILSIDDLIKPVFFSRCSLLMRMLILRRWTSTT
jgi:hypothetical protein